MNIKKIIKTQKIKTILPGIAFLLSLASAGLGQLYNGEMAKGMAFFLLRSLSIIMIPIAVLQEKPGLYILTFMVFSVIFFVITIAAPSESLVRARKIREVPQKWYNSFFWYIVFFLFYTVITALSILVLLSFFSVKRVKDKYPGPVIDQGNYVLVKKYPSGGYTRGDLVFFGDGSVGRVIAIEGDGVRYKENVFFINGAALPLGYLSDGTIRRFTLDSEDIVSETNGGKTYPIRFKMSPAISLENLVSPVARNHILIASDQRLEKNFARTISTGDVFGRVEGIVCSSNLWKIMMDAMANMR